MGLLMFIISGNVGIVISVHGGRGMATKTGYVVVQGSGVWLGGGHGLIGVGV